MTPNIVIFDPETGPKRAQNDAKWASPILQSFWARFVAYLHAEMAGSEVILAPAEGSN